jgi:hypothetical protein
MLFSPARVRVAVQDRWPCREQFLRVHNETLSIVPMRVSNEDRSPVGIHG